MEKQQKADFLNELIKELDSKLEMEEGCKKLFSKSYAHYDELEKVEASIKKLETIRMYLLEKFNRLTGN